MQKKVIYILLLMLFLAGVAFAADVGQNENGDQENSSVFTGDLGESIWTLVSFAVLIIVLWKIAWKPLLASVHGREEYIDRQLSEADNTLKRADEVLAEYKAKLENVEIEGKGILNEYVKRAERESKDHAAKVREELDELRKRLRAEIEHEQRQAKEDFLDQAGDIVVNLGKEVIGKSLTGEDHKNLINAAVLKLKAEEATEGKS